MSAPAIVCLGLFSAAFAAPASPAPPSPAPAELLSMYGLTADALAPLAAGEPLAAERLPVLLKTLYQIRKLPLAVWEAAVADRAASPPAVKVQRVAGALRRCHAVPLAADLAQRFEMPAVYEVQVAADGRSLTIYALDVPQAWRQGGGAGDAVSAIGLHLPTSKVSATLLAAPRVAWHPSTELGRAGMDVGLLDEVDDRSPIGRRDREAFYQMLAAAARTNEAGLFAAARALLPPGGARSAVAPLFKQPQAHRGQLVLLEGVCRRALRVAVDDPDIRQRLGFDHYYELALFADDAGGNPLFVCTPALPPGMPAGDGPQYAEGVAAAGFFFKTWAYRSAASAERSTAAHPQLQVAPLIIATVPIWRPPAPPAASVFSGPIAAIAVGVAAVCLAAVAWRWRREARRWGRGRSTEAPDFSRVEAAAGPDFSKLDQLHPTEERRGTP